MSIHHLIAMALQLSLLCLSYAIAYFTFANKINNLSVLNLFSLR